MTTPFSLRGVYPHLGGIDHWLFRSGGPGLGNMLFPWARALCYAKIHGIPLISPAWPQLKFGPILRRERDLRSYAFQFQSHPTEVTASYRIFLLAACAHIDEKDVLQKRGLPTMGALRTFEGLANYFTPLIGQREMLGKALTQSTVPSLRPDPDSAPDIAVHYRCGDFRCLPQASEALLPKGGLVSGTRLPVELAVDAVTQTKKVLGEHRMVRIYSDGTDEELAPLLTLNGVERSKGGPAITELLELSSARLLIASPHSTFSMWAGFLGAMPYLTFPEAGKHSYGFEPGLRTIEKKTRQKWLRDIESLTRSPPKSSTEA